MCRLIPAGCCELHAGSRAVNDGSGRESSELGSKGAVDGARRPGRPRSANAERTILEATWAEVADYGLHGFSVDKVAARAGVSKATIYRRWATKEALVLDAWAGAESGLEYRDTGSLVGDMRALHLQFDQRHMHEPMRILLPHMVAAAQQNADLAERFHAFSREQRQPLYLLLERAVDRGEIREGLDIEVIVKLLEGPFMLQMLLGDRPMTFEEGEALIGYVLNGIANPIT